MALSILKKHIISALIIIGLILGPLYTVSLYWHYSNTTLRYDNQYYQALSNNHFLGENNTFLGSITTRSIQIVDHSVYALVQSSQNVSHYSFQNFANNGSFELLELNLSTNFDSILSSKTYLLPQLTVNDKYSVVYSYSRVFFDGSRFWFFILPPYQSTKPYHFFLSSFTKQGTILSNTTMFFPANQTTDFQPIVKFLGVFENYFFIADVGSSRLFIYSGENYSLKFSVFLSALADGPYTGYGNVDSHGLVWLQKSNPGPHDESYYVAFSLQQLLATHTSSVQKIINLPHSSNFPLHTDSFHGLAIQFDLQSSWYITSNHLFALQYSTVDATTSVIEGVYVVTVSHIKIPFVDIGIAFFGNLLCIVSLLLLTYSKYRSK